jgi:hypothetical protein
MLGAVRSTLIRTYASFEEGDGRFEKKEIRMNVYPAYGIAALSIVLGFAALLLQKTYLDSRTGLATSIELPVLGKLRTNYPALVFALLGIGLAIFALRSSIKSEWVLTGRLEHPSQKDIDWSHCLVRAIPSEVWSDVSREGLFTIRAFIEDGKSIDEVLDTLDFTHEVGSVQIYLKREHDLYSRGEKSMIKNIAGHTWNFAPTETALYSAEVSQ